MKPVALVALAGLVIVVGCEDTAPNPEASTVGGRLGYDNKAPNVFEDPLRHFGSAFTDVSAQAQQAAEAVEHGLAMVRPAGAWLDHAGRAIGSWTEQAAKDFKHELDKVDLKPAANWLDQAGKDIGGWSEQAVQDVKHELDKADLKPAGDWLDQAGKDIKVELDKVNLGDLARGAEEAGKELIADIAKIKVGEYVKDHPWQTAFHVFNAVTFFTPGLVYHPLLLGFGAKGPIAGSLASLVQSAMGGVVAPRGLFAFMTSARMGGYGTGLFNAVVRLGSVAAGIVNQAVLHSNGTDVGIDMEASAAHPAATQELDSQMCQQLPCTLAGGAQICVP